MEIQLQRKSILKNQYEAVVRMLSWFSTAKDLGRECQLLSAPFL